MSAFESPPPSLQSAIGGRTDPPRIEVRPARPEEAAEIAELTLDAYAEYARVLPPDAWAGYRANILETLAGATAHCLVAESEGSLLGSVLLLPESGVPEIRLLAVPPHGRGLGVGRRLLDEAVARARGQGAAAVTLHTHPMMAVARAMYLRSGFRRVPEADVEVGPGRVIEAMRLDLPTRAPTEDVSRPAPAPGRAGSGG